MHRIKSNTIWENTYALILHFLLRGQSILLAYLLTSYIVILFPIAVGWPCEKVANDLRIGSDNKRNSEILIAVSSSYL